MDDNSATISSAAIAVINTLQPLDQNERAHVLNAAFALFGLSLPQSKQSASPHVASQPATGTQQAAQPGFFEMMVPFIFIFVVFYFLIMRPQGKKQKEHLSFLSALKRGDEVLTASGILGRIEGLTDQYVTLEIADGVRIKMLRNQVAASSKSLQDTKSTVKK